MIMIESGECMGNSEKEQVEETVTKTSEKKKGKKGLIVLIVLLLLCGLGIAAFVNRDKLFKKKENTRENVINKVPVNNNIRISGNSLENFDLYFLKLENPKKNMIYSPLSIKYALEMLGEGANGESKEQIDALIGDYIARKYENSSHMSFGNAMFIRDSYKDSVKKDYIDGLKKKYFAEVQYDSFSSPETINRWVKDKTFKLIPELLDSVDDLDFVLVNALAIDMEWVNKIQSETKDYIVDFHHYEYGLTLDSLNSGIGYDEIKFEGYSKDAKAVRIAAVANRYDLIQDLGEDKVRQIITDEYEKWKKEGDTCNTDPEPTKEVVDRFVKEIKQNNGHLSSSTDFYFDDNDDVKVFAKDLKEYDGTRLQYVGIMPKKQALDEFISNTDAEAINDIIEGIKPIAKDSFKDGYITEVSGSIPMFNFEYELKLMDDLKKAGIVDVFDSKKADLSNMVKGEAVIDKAVHKANIEFSNEGIKAAAATAVGGKGSTGCGFEYLFEVPTIKIDLTFDRPYIFFVRDVKTGEVWFMGTVYEPLEAIDDDED